MVGGDRLEDVFESVIFFRMLASPKKYVKTIALQIGLLQPMIFCTIIVVVVYTGELTNVSKLLLNNFGVGISVLKTQLECLSNPEYAQCVCV